MAELVRVPGEGAGVQALVEFAHTYNGYELQGLDALSEMTRAVREEWERTGSLGDDVDRLRGCLFLEARAHRHSGSYSAFSRDPFVSAAVDRIRALAGDEVPVRGTMA